MNNINSLELAKSVHDYVTTYRQDFHRHPEPSLEEFKTTDKLEAALKEMGIPTRRLNPTGLIGEIKGGKPGKMVALRADMDALPVLEKSGVDFTSENEGYMHACGHDTHISMLLGATKCLNDMKDELTGTVRLIFQPAEEIGKGASLVIEQGGLEGVDYIFGLHIASQIPVGILAISPGPSFAASSTFKVNIKGKSCHGAMPNLGVDATVAASATVMNLQSVVSREVPPLEPVVVTVGKLTSGTRQNIVSGEAYMEGTVRTFNRDLRAELPKIIGRIVEDTAATYRCTAELDYENIIDVVINDPEATAIMKEAAGKIVPAAAIQPIGQQMGSEDFAEYTSKAKASFGIVGGGGTFPQHSDRFFIEEDALDYGVALYLQTAVDALAKQSIR